MSPWQLELSKPQPQHNTTQRLGLTRKWLCKPHPPTQTQCLQYLSCYWLDFDETLKVGSCEHLEHIPTVRVTFIHATFVLASFVHIRDISAVTDPILMKLYRQFQGTSRTVSNCHGDICPGNICPCDICPYQEYLSSKWPDFDETLKIGSWEHLKQI